MFLPNFFASLFLLFWGVRKSKKTQGLVKTVRLLHFSKMSGFWANLQKLSSHKISFGDNCYGIRNNCGFNSIKNIHKRTRNCVEFWKSKLCDTFYTELNKIFSKQVSHCTVLMRYPWWLFKHFQLCSSIQQ